MLHTELVVREDSMTLYGFPRADEAETFRIVQSVSGIGPRTALAVLAVLDPEELRRAVAEQDAKTITRTPRSEEHTSELQSRGHLVCRLLLEKKKQTKRKPRTSNTRLMESQGEKLVGCTAT